MKKCSLALLLSFVIFVTSCSKKSSDNDANNTSVNNIDKSGNLLTTGDSANDILSNLNFTKLQIEIAYVSGFRPTDETVIEFETFIRDHTFKEDIEIIFKELPSPEKSDLSISEIGDLEQENRTAYNNGTTIAIYIYFADAPAADDDLDEGLVTLGAVYRNTSMVIYESTVRSLVSFNPSIMLTDVEATTLNHEFGHLFGLVNLGTTPINDHEDVLLDENNDVILDNNDNPIGNNHCNVAGCLMRAELQFKESNAVKSHTKNYSKYGCAISGKNVLQLLEYSKLSKNKTQSLDSLCILDLQSNGGR